MRDEVKARCENMIANRDTLQKVFGWGTGILWVTGACMFTMKGKTAEEERLKQCRDMIKEKTGIFSGFRGNAKSLITATLALGHNPEGTLEMYMIDVGQADSILFIQGDEVMLVDAGTRGTGDEVVKFLQEKEIDEIDILIGTHPHEDHMGGMMDILENFEIGTFYFPKRSDVTTKYYIEILEYVVDNKIACGDAEAADILSFGEATIQFITSTAPKEDKDLNNCSIVIRVSFGAIDFFLGGDIEKEVEREILASGLEIESEIYKASHHGSDTSNTRDFVEKVNPDYIYISCGLYNKHDHPSTSVIRFFEEIF